MNGLTKLFLIAIFSVTVSQLPSAANAEPVKNLNKSANSVILNEHVVVKSNIIRLGDLFSNTGKDKALVPIAYAPAPGRQLKLDAHWLYRAAKVYKLKWRPFSLQQQSIVERDSIIFSKPQIKDVVQAALIKKGIDKQALIEISQSPTRIYAPSGSNVHLTVESLNIDNRSKRFTAIVTTNANKPTMTRHHVSGWIRNMTQIPVLARRVQQKDIIKKRDVKWILIQSNRLTSDIVKQSSSLIGMTPKRTMGPDKPVRLSDIRPPVMVTKGSLVTMELQGLYMRLTTRGRALEEGGKGDVIRVRNTQSKKEIEAQVIGRGRVSIDPHGHLAMKTKP